MLPVLAGSYLLGSLSFSLIVVWVLRRVDLRTLGSGNAGATNVLRTSGRWPALVVLLLDIGKGIVPVQLVKRLGGSPELAGAAALATILGHVFPVYFGFRGGRGVATAFGAFLALFPFAGASAFVIFVTAVGLTRYVSVGSILASLAVMPLAWFYGRIGWEPAPSAELFALAALAALVVVLRHASNIRRLLAGTERRLGERKSS